MSPADGLDTPRGSHREFFATLLPPEYGAALASEGSQPLLIVVGGHAHHLGGGQELEGLVQVALLTLVQGLLVEPVYQGRTIGYAAGRGQGKVK